MRNGKSNKLIFAISFGNFFDSAFPASTGLVLPYWALAFGINSFGNGLLGALGVNAFGAAIGAIIGGLISDRHGRKLAYRIGLFIMVIGSLSCVITWGFAVLALGFASMGLGAGICVPVAWTYLSELSEAKERSVNLGISQMARPIAIVSMYVIFFVISIVLPCTDANGNLLPAGTYFIFDGLIGARIYFAFISIIGILSLCLQKNIPESTDWKSKDEKILNWQAIKKILTHRKTLLSVIFLTLVYIPWNIVSGTLAQYMPTMATACELNGTSISLISIVVCAISLISVLLFPKLVKKYSYKSLYVFGCISGVLGIATILMFDIQYMSWGNNCQWLIIFFPLFWGAQAGFSAQCFFSIWSTELFPTKLRSINQGISFFLVRGLTGFWSLFVFGVLDAATNVGAAWTLLLMILLLLVSLVTGVIGCPNTQNKSLDEITEERYGEI